MMSGFQKGASVPGRFKWQWNNKSSLNTQLLNDELPGIELSDYRRLSTSDSESPSGLLNGEGLKTEPIVDLDLFFGSLYSYYREKGLPCIALNWIVELFTVAFILVFIWFFLLVVNWQALRNVKCGMEAVESGQKPCDLAKEAINHHPLVPFTFPKAIIVGTMVILTVYGLFNFLKFFIQFKNTLRIRKFYQNSLKVSDSEIQTTPWPAILEKVVQLQTSQQLCVVKDLSAHDMVMRIMRKENYLIGMINKGVLSFPIHWWVPGAGPAVITRENGRRNHLILPKTLEWTLDWCIFQSMFDSKFSVQRDFLTNPSLLKRRLVVVGIVMFLISPCLVIFMLVYLFLKHAEQFYNHPSTASSRRWSNLSKWMFREFNEVDHLFKHRMCNSVVHALDYVKQFPSPLISTVAKFMAFVSGGFAAILIIIAFLDEDLLEGHIFGHNLLWYGAVLGTVIAISRALVAEELQVLDPAGAMSLVVQQTHYMPKRWRGKENSDSVRKEFETLFQYAGKMLLEEMASIFITPYLLIFVVPKRVDDILRFITDFTVDIEGVGHVCSFSAFNFESHGNRKYGSPFGAARDLRSSQGKMEKSFLSFQSAYPTWEPNSHGKRVLSTLNNFKEQQIRRETRQEYSSPPRPWQFTTNFRGQGEVIHNLPSSDVLLNVGNIPDQRTHHPYLLDWYYVSRPLYEANNSGDSPPSCNTATFQRTQGLWPPQNQQLSEIIVEGEENWGYHHLPDRLQSHLEASTSSPLLKDEGIKHRDADHAINRWWDRAAPRSSNPQTSFLEPPDRHSPPPQSSFLEPPVYSHLNVIHQSDDVSADPQSSFLEPPVYSHPNFMHQSDDVSESQSFGEQEENDGRARDLRNIPTMSKTVYMNDSYEEEDEFGLHFADDYRKGEGSGMSASDRSGGALMSLPVKIIPRSNDPVQRNQV
ncbi:autophagy-related protein 9 isoform X2 [Iris pallida]|uniref:Autophagy-related protein 9 n=1 Tax=Iris pallida TaxID=29817 RepID=A0AAX6HUU3_IRIPA|nr:autophagy-related protein 9 isoform X2 [Iris pallida]